MHAKDSWPPVEPNDPNGARYERNDINSERDLTVAAHLIKMLIPSNDGAQIKALELDSSTIKTTDFSEALYLVTAYALSSLASELKSNAVDDDRSPL